MRMGSLSILNSNRYQVIWVSLQLLQDEFHIPGLYSQIIRPMSLSLAPSSRSLSSMKSNSSSSPRNWVEVKGYLASISKLDFKLFIPHSQENQVGNSSRTLKFLVRSGSLFQYPSINFALQFAALGSYWLHQSSSVAQAHLATLNFGNESDLLPFSLHFPSSPNLSNELVAWLNR